MTSRRSTKWALRLGLAFLASLGVADAARADVTPAGSFSSELQIQVPSYRGIEPNLRLVYDSRSGDGPLGVGWKLSGLSEIERVATGRGAPRYDATDVFMLDGAELVRCESDTDSPSCKYPPPGNWVSYATRSETFQRIARSPTAGGGRWTVWRTDGTRFVYTPGNNSVARPYGWTLDTVVDTVGNKVRYRYTEAASGDFFAGERHLDSIIYNGVEIKLYYEPRPTALTYAIGRGIIAEFRRLKAIDVRVGGKRARAYDLGYVTRGPGPLRSFLISVQLYGTDARLDPTTGALSGRRHVPPVRLGYQEPAESAWVGAAAPATGKEAGSFPSGNPLFRDRVISGVGVGGIAGPITTGDVNGDGRTDWVSAGFLKDDPGIHVTTALARPVDATVVRTKFSFEPDPELEGPDLLPLTLYSTSLDLNGDGRSDLLLAIGYPYALNSVVVFEKFALIPALSLGNGTYEVRPAIRTPIDQEWHDGLRACRSGDLDGDGSADIACNFYDGLVPKLLTLISNGDGGFVSTTADLPFYNGGGRRPMAVADHDRDGRADLLFLDFRPEDMVARETDRSLPIRFDLVTGSSPTGSAPGFAFARQHTEWTYVSNPRGAPPDLSAADLNGDGRPDFLAFVPGPTARSSPIAFLTARTQPEGELLLNEQAVPNALSSVETSITIGDSDGDGREDLLVAARHAAGTGTACANAGFPDATLTRVRSQGDGTFALPTTWLDCSASAQVTLRWNSSLRSQEFYAADTNGDGLSDFLVAFAGAESGTILHDDLAPSTGLDTQRWLPAELTGDGRRDWVYVGVEGAHVRVHTLVQREDGTLVHQSRHLPPDLFGEGRTVMRNWKLTDVNADGLTDLVYVYCSGSFLFQPHCVTEVQAFVATGNGDWEARFQQRFALPLTLPETPNILAVDANCDGRGDLVAVLNSVRPGLSGSAVRVQTLLARDDDDPTARAGIFTQRPLTEPFQGVGVGTDTRNWQPMDVDGDCRTDLVHIKRKMGGLEIATLFARGVDEWVYAPGLVLQLNAMGWGAGIPQGDTLNWRPTDVNGDRKADLVHLARTPTGLRLHTLLSDGSGSWTQLDPTDVALASEVADRLGDLDTWLETEVNGDGRGDLVHVRRTSARMHIDALLPSETGERTVEWTVLASTLPDPGPEGDRDSPAWRLTDTDGDGMSDLARIDLAQPETEGAARRLQMSSLRSTARRDLLTRVRGSAGSMVDVTYKPSAAFDVRGSARSCGLPVGATVQVVATTTTRDGRTGTADRTGYDWSCARWSYHSPGFLGWTDSVATTVAAVNRPRMRLHTRYLQTDECQTQVRTTDNLDGFGVLVASGESRAYHPPSNEPPYDCRLQSLKRREYGFTADHLDITTDYAYDEFGNVRNVFEHGTADTTGDERTTGYRFEPALDPWIVGLPAQEFLVEGIHQPSSSLLRSTFYCYDGQNGTDSTSCPGRPTRGLRTAEQHVDDLGLFVTTTYRYDRFGNRDLMTNPRKFGTLAIFDQRRHLYPETVTDVLGTTSMKWNDVQGQVREVTDPNGAVTTTSYDPMGRPTRISTGGVRTVQQRYLDWGDPRRQRIREVLDDGTASGLWNETYFDGLGRIYRLRKKGDAPDVVFEQRIQYSDSSDRPHRRSQWVRLGTTAPPTLHYETSEYDEAGRLVRETHPDGTFRRMRYDTDGKSTSVTLSNERRHDKTVVFDAYGRVVEVREREQATGQFPSVKYTYSAADELLTSTDPNGNVTTNAWDPLGRLRRVEDPDLGVRSFTYDLNGNRLTATDARNRMITFSHDGLDRPTTKTYPSGRKVTWNYDELGHGAAKGQLTSMVDPSASGCPQSRSEERSYDSFGQLTSLTKCIDGRTYTTGFAYDDVGRHRSVTYPDSEVVQYTYDLAGRLDGMPGYVTRMEYDADGRLEHVAYANSTEANFAYDPDRGWLERASVARGSSRLYDAAYTYEPNGIVKSTESTTNKMQFTFIHDDLDRLTDVSGDLTETFRYDAAGNMLLNSSVKPSGNYGYPAQGPAGCPVNGTPRPCAQPRAPSNVGLLSFRYDANGNLSSITDPTAMKSKGIDWNYDQQPEVIGDWDQVVTQYSYDGNGERVSRRRDFEYTRYYGPHVEHSSTRGLIKYYFAGPMLVARNDGSTHWYHADDHGSTRLVTDAQGFVERRVDYAPFGELTTTSVSGGDNRQFAGRRTDEENGLIHLSARFYDPHFAHFVSPDTIVPDPLNTQALNRYAYVYNSPASFTDPSGHEAIDIRRRYETAPTPVGPSIWVPPAGLGAKPPTSPGRPPGQVCSACHGASETYATPIAVPPPGPPPEPPGDPLSLTRLRMSGYDKPRAHYENGSAYFYAHYKNNAGGTYIKWAELLEAGHACAACHLTIPLGHAPTDNEFDVELYRKVALWMAASRIFVEQAVGVGNALQATARNPLLQLRAGTAKEMIGQLKDRIGLVPPSERANAIENWLRQIKAANNGWEFTASAGSQLGSSGTVFLPSQIGAPMIAVESSGAVWYGAWHFDRATGALVRGGGRYLVP